VTRESGYFGAVDEGGLGIGLNAGVRTRKIESQEAAIERTSAASDARVFGLVREERKTFLRGNCGLSFLTVDEIRTGLRSGATSMLVGYRDIYPQ
jgi:hypothetical protein